MKKYILLLIIPFLSFGQSAKLKIASFKMWGDEFNVQATQPNDEGAYSLYLDAYALDNGGDWCGLLINSDKVLDFKNSWKAAKLKYIEWIQTAKENNVTDFKKTMKITIPTVEAYYAIGDFSYSKSFKLYFEFNVFSSGSSIYYSLSLNAKDVLFPKYGNMVSKSFIYSFSSSRDIENFISLLEPKKVMDHYSKKKSTKNLFKD